MAHTKQFENLKIHLEAIKSATNNFADENCIGSGGSGKVYKGKIAGFNGHSMVAFKRLDRALGQGYPQFWNEIMMLSLYKHENIVSLLGFCVDCDEMILVYEYAANRSLDLYLNSDKLTWLIRLKICIGAASGLAFLHSSNETQQRLLHHDINCSNILLDKNWNAKISDFGFSKFNPANQKYPVGIFGYCDPFYQETRLLTKESDVYSFGVVLFEVLCGRLCINNKNDKNQPLVELARQSYEQNMINEIVYGNIRDEINPDSLQVFAIIAYQCLKRDHQERPLMSDVVMALTTAFQYQCLKPRVAGSMPKVINVLTAMEIRRRRRGILNVKIVQGIKVRRINPFANCNPFVTLRLTHTDLQSANQTKVKYNSRNPVWNEEFSLYVENIDVQYLLFRVMSAQSVQKHDYLGWSDMSLKDLISENSKTHNIRFITRKNCFHVCRLKVETIFKPLTYNQTLVSEYLSVMQKAAVDTHDGPGLLVVIIHEARYLSDDQLTGEPYVSLLFRGELRKTKPIKINHDQQWKWKEEFTFMLDSPPRDDKLRLEVFYPPWLFNYQKEPLGYLDIDLVDVVNEKRIIDTCKLTGKGGGGLIDVELQWRILDQS